ncbi:prephenate dehydratase [Marinobacterium mangrovicola]|uniref:Bifunctional chorismate mutase/prephenate dehydratase n=1 Tax=Marinobacterium mangrovicola TaxID=1476959 RepID=A0A4R1GFP8_9GAMM|nr:prephenate dehydratase [Marinobacterium mangrovicola]TCK03042.1 chorismate mutase [Marinobacterium mangrovicola]
MSDSKLQQEQREQEQALGKVRDRIDEIDREIHRLLNERARCAQTVAEIKTKGGTEAAVFYRPEREAQVLRKVMSRNEGPLPDQEVARLFREVMSVCLALEQPLNVVFLGPEANFTQQAALKHFGHSVRCSALDNLEAVFRDVEAGHANYGVVPIENAEDGVVNHALDLFSRFNLGICGEVELSTHQHLLMVDSAELDKLEVIYAHPFAINQCRHWIDARCGNLKCVEVESNAEAARRAAESSTAAAIGGDIAADLFNLKVVQSNIEDQPDNRTRYLVVGRQAVGASGQDKTSILLMAHDRPGALYELLEPFRKRNISLTRVESRAAPQSTWDMLFYVDFEGHEDSAEVAELLQELESGSVELKRLGSYPKAVL